MLHAPTFRFLAYVLATLASAAAARGDLAGEVSAAVRAADLGRASVSIVIADLDAGKLLVSMNPDAAMIPASNMKLLTGAAALHLLGPDFKFRTELRRLTAADGGESLVVVGDGDPGFCDPKLLEQHGLTVEDVLAAWVKAVKDAGIARVARLVVDDRVFDDQAVHPGWPAGQLKAWYCAQVSGLNFYDNCLDVYARPTQPGAPARIDIVPRLPGLSLRNGTITGARDQFGLDRRDGGNDLVATGTVRVGTAKPVNITVHDPPVFFAQVLASRLAEAGIAVAAIERAGRDFPVAPGTRLHAVQTLLPAALGRCLKDSQNLFAEALLKRMGREASGKPGSWSNGADAVRGYLRKQFGDGVAGAVTIADGSGMSRENRVSARVLAALLESLHRDKTRGPIFLESLAVAGRDGTLDDRLKTGLAGAVHAKSGYLNGVSSLAGYVRSPDGKGGQRTAIFSFLFNDFRAPTTNLHIKALQDRLVLLVDGHLAARAPVR